MNAKNVEVPETFTYHGNMIHPFTICGEAVKKSGFTPKKSTEDRTLGLCVLTECLCDLRSGLSATYVDLRKALNSVNRDLLWKILALRAVHPKLVNMIYGL